MKDEARKVDQAGPQEALGLHARLLPSEFFPTQPPDSRLCPHSIFFKVLDLPSPHSLLGLLVLTLGLYSQGFPSPHPLTAQPARSLCAQTPAGRVLAGMLSLLWPTGADMDWKLRNVSLETPTFEVGSRKTSGLFSFLFLVHTDPTLSGTRMWTVSHSLHNWDYTAVFGDWNSFFLARDGFIS